MAYLPLSTANLPDPAIDPAQGSSPQDYFNTVTYTGTGADNDITGVGFQPDFVWIKSRGADRWHQMFDVIRGQYDFLSSNTTNEGIYDVATLESFDSDGFNLNTSNRVNGSSEAYVAWNWKANGSGVSNTDGSITSTVSANTESGFSVITWVGNATLNATIGHGLSSSPEMIIVKNRSVTNSWIVQHHSVTGYLTLNSGGAVAGSNVFTPSSTTIEFDSTWDAINGNGNNMLCYAFHSVEGSSKFGSYIGNGSNDGTFVYTGFRPALLLVRRTNNSDDWELFDTARTSYNGLGIFLRNTSAAEARDDNYPNPDFLSNGFKWRSIGGSVNDTGHTYIYMAFAENPFKYSNAR